MKRYIFLLLFYIILHSTFIFGQKPAIITSNKPGWHKLTETIVDLKIERKEVEVLGADRFSSLKFRVTEAPLRLDSIYVYFEDDSVQNIAVHTLIKAGGQSGVIHLT